MRTRSQVANEASRPLAEELKKTDDDALKEAAKKKIEGFTKHVARYPAHPRLADDFERIIETTFKVEVEKTYRRLVDALVIEGVSLGDRGAVSQHLNRAEENFREAHNLMCLARQQQASWDLQQRVVRSAMYNAATQSLQDEKSDGKRNKQITDADVGYRALELFPDEWRHCEEREVSVKLMVEKFVNLAEVWKSRCFSLRTLLDSRR